MKPMLFNTAMVQAIQAGQKTVTRRLVKPRYKADEAGFTVCTNKRTYERWVEKYDADECRFDTPRYVYPLYQQGDIIYVRETVRITDPHGEYTLGNRTATYTYKDGESLILPLLDDKYLKARWWPSLHMPREAARLFLKVKGIEVERVQDITAEGAIQEGALQAGVIPHSTLIRNTEGTIPRTNYKILWNSIYAHPTPAYKKINGRKEITHYESYPWEEIKETRDYRGKPWYVRGNPWVWAIDFIKGEKPEGIKCQD